jgi:hypothetical protein
MAGKIHWRMRLCSLCLFWGASFLPSAAQDAPPSNPPQPDGSKSAQTLLIQSYIASQQLVPQERAMVLMYLALTATPIEPAYNRLWSEELFYFAFQLPQNWNRVAYEKNALEALSESDPVLALELLGRVEDPIPTDSGSFPEDVRAFAAQKVFLAYWQRKGQAHLDEIRAQGQHLGATGQYPYVAMIPIVLDLARSNENLAEAVFNEAATYFSRGSRFDSANPDFLQFLNSVWEVLPAPLKHQALDVAVTQLTRQPVSSPDEKFRGTSRTSSHGAEFTDQNRQLLFELLPRIREVDPQWAKRLLDKEPWLVAATESGGIHRSDSAVIQNASSASPEQMAAAEQRLRQRQTLAQVEREAGKDPSGALLTSRSLTDPEFQAVALANIAAGFAKNNPATAGQLLDQANGITSKLKGSPEKVTALFAKAKADYALHDLKAMQTSWTGAFDIGQELFQEDIETHPDRLAYQAACFDNLANLAKFGGKVEPQMVLQAIGVVRNQLLRAYLPIFAAEGIFDHQQMHLQN